MDLMEAMKNRHSVRQFTDRPLEETAVATLQKETDRINKESGLHIQLITNEPDAFDAGAPSNTTLSLERAGDMRSGCNRLSEFPAF